MIALLLAVALLSPRQAETFGGTRMVRRDPLMPQFTILPPLEEDIQPLIAVNSSSQYAEEYIYTIWNSQFTNVYLTKEPMLEFSITNQTERIFVTVTATNDWGSATCTNAAFWPPYPPDRFMVTVAGKSSFSLEWSPDIKKWSFYTNATTPVTIITTGNRRWFRGVGQTNKVTELSRWNPLNK